MNLLLITFSFPPAGGVGVQRALSLAKYLPEHGIRVDVLTARNAPAVGRDLSLLSQVPRAVTIHRTPTLDLPFALRKRLKGLLSKGHETSGEAKVNATEPVVPIPVKAAGMPTLRQRLRAFIGNLLLPDPQVGWLPFAAPAARRIIRRRRIDAVLITVPPFSSLRLCSLLRRSFPGLPIVIDFRDEWLDSTMHLVSFSSSSRAAAVAEITERTAVQDSTAVVLVTEAAQNTLRARYPEQPAAKFHYLPNGWDGMAPVSAPAASLAERDAELTNGSSAAEEAGPVLLTYMGTLYGSTDPRMLVEAVASLPRDARRRLRLRFVGHVETPALRAALLSLGNTVELRGFLPQAEAFRTLGETDYLLLITRDPINVSAKFYDYLRAGRPILAAIHPEGEVRALLERTRAGQWADGSNPLAIREMLLTALQRGRSGAAHFNPDRAAIDRFHRRRIARDYAALLADLTRGTS